MSDDQKPSKNDALGDLTQEAELDRIMLEATTAPPEKVRAELAAAGYTRGKVDAIFKGHVRGLRPPRLKYVGVGALIGFALGVAVGASLPHRSPAHEAPAADAGAEGAATIRGDLVATTNASAEPLQTAGAAKPADAQAP